MPKPIPSSNSNELVLIKATRLEAHVLKILRSVPYGEVTVKMAHGSPYQVIPQSSVLLKPEEANDLIVREE